MFKVISLVLACMICILPVSAGPYAPATESATESVSAGPYAPATESATESVSAVDPAPDPVVDDPHWYDWFGEHKILTAVIVVVVVAVVVTCVVAAAASAASDAVFSVINAVLVIGAAVVLVAAAAAIYECLDRSSDPLVNVTDGEPYDRAALSASDFAEAARSVDSYDGARPSECDCAAYAQRAVSPLLYTVSADSVDTDRQVVARYSTGVMNLDSYDGALPYEWTEAARSVEAVPYEWTEAARSVEAVPSTCNCAAYAQRAVSPLLYTVSADIGDVDRQVVARYSTTDWLIEEVIADPYDGLIEEVIADPYDGCVCYPDIECCVGPLSSHSLLL